MSDRDFSDEFIWGAASCPACSEGETVSDWGRFSAPDGSVPDDGPRHWRRYRYDFRSMASLGVRAYRFGCDWGRLQREPYGEFVRDDLYRYLEMLAELRSLGVDPWLVLFQDALPRWAAAAGGWLNSETPHWFADYVRRLADATDGEAGHWLTVHEPHKYAFSRHAWGWFPDGEWGRLDLVRRVLANLRLGHQLASRELRRRLPGCRVGIGLPGGAIVPRRFWHPGDRFAALVADWCLNRHGLRSFLDDKKNGGEDGCDFIMVGAVGDVGVDAGSALSASSLVSGEAAEKIRPGAGDCLAAGLRRWTRLAGVPVYAVGGVDGCARDALARILAACSGSGIQGFFYEPLMDQFDLRRGLAAGRGLLRVDFHAPDRRREFREAARFFQSVIKTGKLS